VRIIELQVDNIKGIRTATVRPDGDVVVISGRNGQGKSSILDGMLLAIAGGKASKLVEQPIRKGETRASVRVDLGDFTVTRTWREGGSSVLDVRNRDGMSVPSQQKFLDGLNGALWFDPLAFAAMKAADQRSMLLDLITLPFDPQEMRDAKKALYDERTIANREAKALTARFEAAPTPLSTTPDEEVAASTLMERFQEAQELQAANDVVRHNLTAAEEALDRANEVAADLEERLEKARAAVDVADAWCAEKHKLVEALEDPDLDELKAELERVDEVNSAVREKKAWIELRSEVAAAMQEAMDLNDRLNLIVETEQEAIAEAEMPIEGLAFDEDGVTFNGVPFTDLSSAEQLKVSVAMGMALNPTLRVMRIMDGSLLDEESIKVISELAGTNDYQVWLEIVSSSGDYGFVIEDGTVVRQPPPDEDEF
jgi:recombinational DNA repair ATPase RecF